MIGNDIVDLSLAKTESNWKRKGFLEKIFTKQEQLKIKTSINPEITIWNFWSRKEAAYKIYNRISQVSQFIPLKLECFDNEVVNGIVYGKVECLNEIYFTKTEINKHYIYTEAVCKVSDFDKLEVIKRPENVQKIHGIPSFFDFRNEKIKPISITHHGQFERIITINSTPIWI